VGSLSGSSASGSGEDRLSFRDQQAVNDAIEAAAFGPSSMYRGDVTMSHSVRSAGSSNPQQEYLQLSVSSRADGPISISGWRVVSDVSGNGAVIPQGTEVPRSGTINASQPIVLQPGDRAIITSGRSPIGASFRENVCIASEA
jgi:hypothetical protein